MKLQTKKEFRDFAKKLRASLAVDNISRLICENIKNQEIYKNSENTLGFYPLNNEINLVELFKDNSKSWFLPSVDASTKELFIHQYKFGDKLKENRFKVLEPLTPAEKDFDKIDLVFVPALMADKKGYRLGYGAGYYDRFLPLLKKSCIKFVTVPDELFIENLPTDNFDVPVDFVFTEKRVYIIK